MSWLPLSSSRLPICTCKASCRNSEARRRMAGGQVAVKKSVCRCRGTRARILRICGSKPMSSMRSASSSTRSCTAFRLTAFISMRSCKRPGVATSTCGFSRIAWACGPLGTPPKTASERTLANLANLEHSASICVASSRVGASTRTGGLAAEEPPLAPPAASVSAISLKAGSRKARVLPLPVLATATRSLPVTAAGQPCAWMGEGAVKPAARSAFCTFLPKGASSKLCTGSGSCWPSLAEVMWNLARKASASSGPSLASAPAAGTSAGASAAAAGA
mmetsp:Transcript_63351/g.196584  ORF Transcript_63351/g.196584 Transcript_63351/m.196584 type:complete len:276 (+) Transcript_63351:665-1492(+)